MKCVIFRSSKGDCLIVSKDNGDDQNTNIMVDGGMSTSFKKNVTPYLSKNIREKGEIVDLLCVSHIDDDHIIGVLKYMELMTEWRVYKYHKSQNTPNIRKPKLPEPPEVKTVWHNSFAESYDLGEVLPKIEQSLHTIQIMTSPHHKDDLLSDTHEKVASVKSGITLSQRLKPSQLGIPLNEQYRGRVVKCNQSTVSKNEHKIGDINLTVLGPFSSDLTKLKKDWIEWEKENQAALKEFYEDLSLTALNSPLGTSEITNILINSGSINPKLGERGEVSLPNLASIMFLLESNGKTILMTGDGHHADIIKGLKKNKKLNAKKAIHVNILKIQHHGAGANIEEEFCKKVTADYYVFCGNGSHDNPDIKVLETIFNSRRGNDDQKSENSEVDDKFEFWFNVNPKDKLTKKQAKHIELVDKNMKAFKAKVNDNSFGYKFMSKSKSFMTIEL